MLVSQAGWNAAGLYIPVAWQRWHGANPRPERDCAALVCLEMARKSSATWGLQFVSHITIGCATSHSYALRKGTHYLRDAGHTGLFGKM